MVGYNIMFVEPANCMKQDLLNILVFLIKNNCIYSTLAQISDACRNFNKVATDNPKVVIKKCE